METKNTNANATKVANATEKAISEKLQKLAEKSKSLSTEKVGTNGRSEMYKGLKNFSAKQQKTERKKLRDAVDKFAVRMKTAMQSENFTEAKKVKTEFSIFADKHLTCGANVKSLSDIRRPDENSEFQKTLIYFVECLNNID